MKTDVPLLRPTTQTQLTALAGLLDEVFEVPPPGTMLRVGFLFDLVRSNQFLLLAGTEAEPMGAVVAFRGRNHIELVDMVVAPTHQAQGIGRSMFKSLTEWTANEGYDEIKWSVSPSNLSGVRAYLSYGARIVEWLDNAYGVAADAHNRSENTDKFRGSWRVDSKTTDEDGRTVAIDDYSNIRTLLQNGWQIISRTGTDYRLHKRDGRS